MSVTLTNSDMCTVLGYQFPNRETVSADGSIIKVFFSHGSSTTTATMRAIVLNS